MKRIISTVLILSLLLSISACSRSPVTATPLLGGLIGTGLPTAPTVHIHVFSPATCTDPERCACGQTQGEPTGHRWIEANCLAPVLCLNCNMTKGEPTAHIYRDGSCSFCGKGEYEIDLGPQVWIGIHGGIKYHSRSDCSNMLSPVKISLSIAERYGYTACKKCW